MIRWQRRLRSNASANPGSLIRTSVRAVIAMPPAEELAWPVPPRWALRLSTRNVLSLAMTSFMDTPSPFLGCYEYSINIFSHLNTR